MDKVFEEFEKVGKDSLDAAVRSLGDMNKGLQAIAVEVTDYSKMAVEDSMRAFEQLMGAKTLEQAIEIQSKYAKKAYDAYMAEMSKLRRDVGRLGQERLQARRVSFGQEDDLTSASQPQKLPTKKPRAEPSDPCRFDWLVEQGSGTSLKDTLISKSLIPSDSFLSSGEKFEPPIWYASSKASRNMGSGSI
jgi:hypothetical protein